MAIHRTLKRRESRILQGSGLGYFSEALSTLHLCLLFPNSLSQSIYLIHSYFLKTPYFMGLNKMILFPQHIGDNSCCPFPFSRIEYFKITATRAELLTTIPTGSEIHGGVQILQKVWTSTPYL